MGYDAVRSLAEGSPQQRFGLDQRTERFLQGNRIRGGFQKEYAGHVVGQTTGVQHSLDIHTLLHSRQGVILADRRFGQAGRVTVKLRLGCDGLATQISSQTDSSPAGIQIRDPDPLAQHILNLHNTFHGVKGIAAREEIVGVAVNILPVQDGLENVQNILGGGGKRADRSVGGKVWHGQTLFVNFAVAADGQFFQINQEGGDHILGQIGSQMAQKLHLVDLGLGAVIGADDLLIIQFTDSGDGFGDAGVCFDAGRDLLQFYPQTTQFHLVVQPASKNDLAVGSPAGNVTGIIDSIVSNERIGPETLFGEFRLIAIAMAHAFATDIQMAKTANGQGIHPLVQHVQTAVAHGTAGGDPVGMRQFFQADAHGRFRGAILVVDFSVAQSLDLLEQFRREGFAAADDALHSAHSPAERAGLQESRQAGGGGGEETDGIAMDQRGKPIRGFQLFFAGQYDGSSVKQGYDAF